MKIIVQGTWPATCLHGRCGACGCVFECERAEAVDESSPMGMCEPYTKCPTCHKEVRLKGGHYRLQGNMSYRD